jgi:hypothetical protein
MVILDAAGKEVKIGDRVAYASKGYMSLNIANVQGFTPKGIRMVVGEERDWRDSTGLTYKDRLLTRLSEQFVVIGEIT